MHCLLTPALALMMHFKGQRLIDQAKRELHERVASAKHETSPDESELELEDVHAQLLASASQMQGKLAAMSSNVLTIISFGTLVPIMLLLAPLTMLLNLRARQWIVAHSEERSFGVLTAERILVHPPIFLIRNLGYGLNILIMAFVFLDLEVGFTNALMPATS